MSNAEIVRSIYEAVNRRDWDAAFRDQRPDVELTTPPLGPRAGTSRGVRKFRGTSRAGSRPLRRCTPARGTR
jgi:ketosteroid isomerase-like protein